MAYTHPRCVGILLQYSQDHMYALQQYTHICVVLCGHPECPHYTKNIWKKIVYTKRKSLKNKNKNVSTQKYKKKLFQYNIPMHLGCYVLEEHILCIYCKP